MYRKISVLKRGVNYIFLTKTPRRRTTQKSPVGNGLKPFPTGLSLLKAIAYHNTGARRRPTLPRGEPPSTIGDAGLNFRVRDGNGWCPCSKIGRHMFHFEKMEKTTSQEILTDSAFDNRM